MAGLCPIIQPSNLPTFQLHSVYDLIRRHARAAGCIAPDGVDQVADFERLGDVTLDAGAFHQLGVRHLGGPTSIVISNEGANGHVIIDAVRFRPQK